jgi:proteasome activator subunit 4
MLSTCVVYVGDAVLNFKQELFDVAGFMQEKCRGFLMIHISNFIHHLLLGLTATYTTDFSLYEPDVVEKGIDIRQWEQTLKPGNLTVKWHVPKREKVKFAAELFKVHSEKAIKQLKSLTDGTSIVKRGETGKEWSDEVSKNVNLLRLMMSGMSILFHIKKVSKNSNVAPPEAHGDTEINEANRHVLKERIEKDQDLSLNGIDEDAIKPTFQYPVGYVLAEDDPLFCEIQDLREQAGELFHNIHRFLTEKQEDDVAYFSALYTAYRSWFIDVGLERSAQALKEMTRSLASDIGPYKVSGLRKDYPRPLLIRRAHRYYLQRRCHNVASRRRSALDEKLLLDLAESGMSPYTKIRQNAQSAGESALIVIIGARLLIIPTLVEALEIAVKENDYPRIKGAIWWLLFGRLTETVGRH